MCVNFFVGLETSNLSIRRDSWHTRVKLPPWLSIWFHFHLVPFSLDSSNSNRANVFFSVEIIFVKIKNSYLFSVHIVLSINFINVNLQLCLDLMRLHFGQSSSRARILRNKILIRCGNSVVKSFLNEDECAHNAHNRVRTCTLYSIH